MSVTLNTNTLNVKDPNTGEYVNVAVYGASGEVADWLNKHPEATTTVQDKSITPAKFADSTVSYIEQVTDRHTAEEIASSVETETAKQVAQMQVKEGQTVIDATLTVSGAAADAKKTGDEITELKNEVSGIKDELEIKSELTKEDADYNLQVKTSTNTATDDPEGTRIRIIFRLPAGSVIKASCSYGDGTVALCFITLGLAVNSYPPRAIQKAPVSGEYTKSEISFVTEQDSYVSFSLCKTDRSIFTSEERQAAFDDLDVKIVLPDYSSKRLEQIESDIQYVDKYSRLRVGELVNGHLTNNGVVDDAFTQFRLSTKEVVAFPCGSNIKIRVKLNENYLFAIRCGATSTNLDQNLYWYTDGDEITIPSGANYYAISVCNVAGTNAHLDKEISPTEDIGLELLYEHKFNIIDVNAEQAITLDNARLFFSSSQLNTINKYAVIGHTSDCHGDYKRVDNFLKFCDNCGADVACITGDIVSYKPSQEIKWFNDLLNSHKVLPAVCTGNHDVYDDNMTDDDIYDFMFADVAEKIGNETGKTWYYKDLADKKLRIVSINLYQFGGSSRWYTHFTDEQIEWFINILKNTPVDYGVIVLTHAAQVSLDNAKDPNYETFFQSTRLYNNPHNAVSGGVPVYDIIDAFISRGTLNKTYTQTGTPASVTVSADFTSVDSSVEFIAHLTGHFHQDSICYVPGRTNRQLMLNVTCTNAIYGGTEYPYLADIQDQARNNMDVTQDAFNMYVIDRDNKTVKVVRIGNTKTYQMQERQYMEIPYAE